MSFARNRRGSAVLLVILFIFVMSITGMAILYMNGRQEIIAVNDVKETAAYQAAQSGLELGRAWFRYRCVDGSPGTFPEHLNHNANPINPFIDGSHPDGTWQLSANSVNPVQGVTSYRIRIVPCAGNNVNIMGNTGVIGNYVVISSGIVSTGVTGSYDYIKITSETVRVHYHTDNKFYFRVVDNSWVEEPMKRIVH